MNSTCMHFEVQIEYNFYELSCFEIFLLIQCSWSRSFHTKTPFSHVADWMHSVNLRSDHRISATLRCMSLCILMSQDFWLKALNCYFSKSC